MAITKVSRGLLSTGVSDSSDATAITIDSSENVGIGTSSPNRRLTVFKSSSPVLNIKNSDADLHLEQAGQNSYIGNSSTSGFLQLFTNNGNATVNMLANGNVGIGTTSPAFKLDVNGSLASNGNENVMRIAGSDTNNAGGITINAVYGNTATSRVMTLFSIDGQDQASPLAFGNGTSEAMRIDPSGNFLVGKTSATQSSAGFQISGNNLHNVTSTNTSNGSSTFMVHDGSNLNFYVNFTGQVFYRVGVTDLSDQRLKENIVNLDKGLDDILKIKPRRFDWIEGEGEKNQMGFIAQEIEEAGLEELVSPFKGASLDDAKGVNRMGLIPILVKAIQEQQEQIEALQSEINTLKGGE